MKNQDPTGTNLLLGILGNPVSHSLSPNMQQSALDALGIPMRYLHLPVEPDQLSGALDGIRSLPFRGVNVTIPYKQAVMPYLDQLDATAQEANAVNVILNDHGCLIGYNTDSAGFMSGFSHGSDALRRGRVLLVGAGGAACAIVAGLMRRVSAITVVARDTPKAQTLLNTVGAAQHCQTATLPWPVTPAMIADHGIIVNATPIGMQGFSLDRWLPEHATLTALHTCYDTVYIPQDTPFLVEAKRQGAHCIYGKAMLVGQGEVAFQHFTGQCPPPGLMQTVLDASLSLL